VHFQSTCPSSLFVPLTAAAKNDGELPIFNKNFNPRAGLLRLQKTHNSNAKTSHPPKKVSKTMLTSPWLTRLNGLGTTVQEGNAVADASFGRMVSTSYFFLVVKASKSPFLIRLPLSVSWAAPETGPVRRKEGSECTREAPRQQNIRTLTLGHLANRRFHGRSSSKLLSVLVLAHRLGEDSRLVWRNRDVRVFTAESLCCCHLRLRVATRNTTLARTSSYNSKVVNMQPGS
jgi:hypothetical protein